MSHNHDLFIDPYTPKRAEPLGSRSDVSYVDPVLTHRDHDNTNRDPCAPPTTMLNRVLQGSAAAGSWMRREIRVWWAGQRAALGVGWRYPPCRRVWTRRAVLTVITLPAMALTAANGLQDPPHEPTLPVHARDTDSGVSDEQTSGHVSRALLRVQDVLTRPAAEADTSDESVDQAQPNLGLDADQSRNAAVIIEVGRDMDVPERGQVVALATALQESMLYNLANHAVPESRQAAFQGFGSDHDSIGLFQQRHTMGWGSVAELMDPAYASQAFYRALNQVDSWQDMSITQAAQAVQASAYPDHYAQWEEMAWEILQALASD